MSIPRRLLTAGWMAAVAEQAAVMLASAAATRAQAETTLARAAATWAQAETLWAQAARAPCQPAAAALWAQVELAPRLEARRASPLAARRPSRLVAPGPPEQVEPVIRLSATIPTRRVRVVAHGPLATPHARCTGSRSRGFSWRCSPDAGASAPRESAKAPQLPRTGRLLPNGTGLVKRPLDGSSRALEMRTLGTYEE